jgi:hypothetical protein
MMFKKKFLHFLLLISLLGATSEALAYSTSQPTTISTYSIDWDQPNLTVIPSGPVYNPENCSDP